MGLTNSEYMSFILIYSLDLGADCWTLWLLKADTDIQWGNETEGRVWVIFEEKDDENISEDNGDHKDDNDNDDDDDDDSARCLAGARAFSVARGTLDSGLSGASTVVPGRATNYTS